MEAAQIPDNAIPFQGILFSSGGNPALGRVGIGGGEGGVTNGVATGGGTTVVVAGVEATTGAGVGVVVAAGAVPTTGAGAGGGAEGEGAEHEGTVMVSASLVTVPPNANALPVHVTVLPTVTPEGPMSVPMNVEFAPSVVAAVGVQNTSQELAPPATVTAEFATEVKAPATLKTYVPLPESVTPPVPMEVAPVIQ